MPEHISERIRERISIVTGDITRLRVDAIVNTANERLMGGGGADGAIHAAAGPGLLDACRALGGCPTGEARLTHGYDLPASRVIHTVGPVWQGGDQDEEGLLAACYGNSLALAALNGIETIAFPAISTGAYGFPANRAAVIVVDAVSTFLADDDRISAVVLCCFDARSTYHHKTALAGLPG